jgi:hypothetical protein
MALDHGTSLEDRRRDLNFKIRQCERRLDEIDDLEQTYGKIDESTLNKRYDLRTQLTDHRDALKFYDDNAESLGASFSRIKDLPHVLCSGAQDFAVELARKLRQCYDNGDLERPTREDRGHPCFHSDIEYALDKLKQNGGRSADFANDWLFVREGQPGYDNLPNPLNKNTNPDFVSTKRGAHGYFVIEAKFDQLGSSKTKRDRYKGQQADYLSSDCEGVILLAYEERCTSSDLRELLRKELEGVFDMRAVAVGVVNTTGVEQLPSAEEDIDGDGGFDIESQLSDGEDYNLPEPSPEALTPGSTPAFMSMSEDLLKPEALGGDRRLWDLWLSIKAETPEHGRPRILDWCFFDVPRYMLEIRNYLHDKRQWLKPDEHIPEMLAGGSTQMGKTMFIVIGVCVAKKLEAASVVITHKVAGRNSLAHKIRDALDALNKADKLGQLNPRCMAYAEEGKTEANRRDMLENDNCIVISDTAAQIAEARGSMYNILKKLQHESESRGRFILFKDEADSMLRTNDRRLRLETSIDKLTPSTSNYHGAQLVINISATLMPVFLEMARTRAKPRGPVFLTSVPRDFSIKYSGVVNFSPLKSVDPKLHLDVDAEATDSRPLFLDPSLSRDPDSLGINKQVDHIFEDACSADGAKKKALLLDISLTKVYVEGSIFDKAEVMQAKHPNLHVVVYCGRGVVVNVAKGFVPSVDGIDVDSATRRGKVLLPEWKPRIIAPDAGQKGGAWYTTALKDDWGKVSEARRSTIGPGKRISDGARRARVDEVLNALEFALETAGRGDDPIAVFGYSMMARGESFVTDQRVPSHLVLFMTAGASFDLLVQTAGRATFLREHLLHKNGWVDEKQKPVVRVLMPEQDYKVIRRYPDLINLVDQHVRGGTSLEELFSDESVLKEVELLQDFADSRRHGFGDKRKAYPTGWMGSDDSLPDGSESLADVLQRLKLPKKYETIWFDYSASGDYTWYECTVSNIRLKDGAEEPFEDRDVEYLLKCTDRSIVSLDEWLLLDVDSAWTRKREDIPRGANIHEPWILKDSGKIRKVVQELLKEQPGSWLTAKGIEDHLHTMALTAGRSLGGLSGDDLRHCMDSGGSLPGAVLQYLSERARPATIQRRRHLQLPDDWDCSAWVQSRKDGRKGTIRDITSLPSSAGPMIELDDGKTMSASDFTGKTRDWPSHLIIVEQPVGKQLLEPVSYVDFVGSSKYSSSVAPQGLFEYSYDTRAATTGKPPPRRTVSAPAGASSSRDTPPRRAREPGAHESRSVPSRSQPQRTKRPRVDPNPISVTGIMNPDDMRTIIEHKPNWEELHELLSKLLDDTDLDRLKGDPAKPKYIPKALRRECIDRCDAMKTPDDKERLSWEHFNTLRDDTLESWCLIFAVDAEDDDWDSRSRRWRRLPKSEMANKLAAMIRSQAESDSS